MILPERQAQWHLIGAESVVLREVPLEAPRGREILLRIEAATTCGTDLKVYRQGGHARMLQPPCPFGHEMAGSIVAVGPDQERWVPGDRVVVANSASCGVCLDCRRRRENLCSELQYLNGAFAEYLLVPERFTKRSTYRVPESLSSELAALSEPLACAVHCVDLLSPFLDQCLPAGGVTAAVYGSGPLGLLLVGELAERGVGVMSADPNAQRLEMAKRFGARATCVIERTGHQSGPVLAAAEPWVEEGGYDIAVDATGSQLVWLDCMRSVRKGGHVVFFGGTAAGVEIPVDARFVHYSEITLHGAYHHRPQSFERALDLLASRSSPFELLLSEKKSLDQLEAALQSMMERRALKVVLTP